MSSGRPQRMLSSSSMSKRSPRRTAGTVAAKPARHAVAAISRDTVALSASTRTGSGTTASVVRTCMARAPTARAGRCFL
uniref:Alternative protein CBFA2T2 n=1 Tax=Homo sapiens TaxID=9606 RepID=L8EAD6_HUMAN|nr:alternative protein CBFA2T2 [Homo sapiens]